MKRMIWILLVTVTMITLGSVCLGEGGSWATLNVPNSASVLGIDGNNVVGFYVNATGSHGLLYDYVGKTLTKLDVPGAQGTVACGVSGKNVVGFFYDSAGNAHSFLYNGTAWAVIDKPGTNNTCAYGVDGNKVVGTYGGPCGSTTHAFLYDHVAKTWTNIDKPGAIMTTPYGVSGNNVVGYYDSSSGPHGFLYNGTTWTTLDMPGAISTCPYGVSGNNIVGFYSLGDGSDWHGFLYNGETWTTIDMPGAVSTLPGGISGNNIAGIYMVGYYTHSFLYTMPDTMPGPSLKIGVVNGTVAMSFNGAPGSTHNIEASSDLVHWSVVATVTVDANGKGTCSQPATGPARYYRIPN